MINIFVRFLFIIFLFLLSGCFKKEISIYEPIDTSLKSQAQIAPIENINNGASKFSNLKNDYNSDKVNKSIQELKNYSNIDLYQDNIVKIGLMLPLSGKFKNLGENLLDAAQLALFDANYPHIALLPVDTRGSSFGAVEAAKELISKDVKLVIGPLFSKSTKSVIPIFQEHDINLISFSNDNSLANNGAFYMGMLPEQQIMRIINFSMLQGITDYSAILPNNSLGALVAKNMREMVSEYDFMSVLKTEFYRLSNKNKAINLRKHVYSAYNAALSKKPQRDYDEELEKYNDNPIIYPRALVIAEGGENLEKITDLLEKYNLDADKVKLIGSDSWLTKENLSNPILQGAWFAASAIDKRIAYEQSFADKYGYRANKLSSLAYDAVALSVVLTKIYNGKNYTKEAIADGRGFLGIDGIFKFENDGRVRRGFAIYRINNGSFEIIDPSPKTFAQMGEREVL